MSNSTVLGRDRVADFEGELSLQGEEGRELGHEWSLIRGLGLNKELGEAGSNQDARATMVTKDHIQGTKLSSVDKEILKILLEPDGNVSTRLMEMKLGIPRSTIQRRRRRLEQTYLEHSYSLNLANLGFRRIDLLISTGGGATDAIAHELLTRNEVVYVGTSIGEHTIDLRAEVIIKDNSELLGLLELVKAMVDVKDVVWSEIVDVIGKKRSIPSSIIDML
jgi:DNA-binding Lrp family transcriptional regulator